MFISADYAVHHDASLPSTYQSLTPNAINKYKYITSHKFSKKKDLQI